MRNEFFQSLYHSAHIPTLEVGSVSLWNYFTQQSFPENHFLHDTQVPASSGDPLRCVDGALKYFEKDTLRTKVLFFHEAKKPGQADSQVQEVEGQAFEACGTYL